MISHQKLILTAVLDLKISIRNTGDIREQSASACRGVMPDKLPSAGRVVIFLKSETYQGNERRAAPEQHLSSTPETQRDYHFKDECFQEDPPFPSGHMDRQRTGQNNLHLYYWVVTKRDIKAKK